MATSYKPQATLVNEEPTSESSLNLTLTKHLCDENPKSWEVCAGLEVDPPRTWYYHISPNSCTLMILLQVDFIFGDEFETICEGCYKIKNTSMFAWSSIPDVRHYRCLCSPIVDCFLIVMQNT